MEFEFVFQMEPHKILYSTTGSKGDVLCNFPFGLGFFFFLLKKNKINKLKFLFGFYFIFILFCLHSCSSFPFCNLLCFPSVVCSLEPRAVELQIFRLEKPSESNPSPSPAHLCPPIATTSFLPSFGWLFSAFFLHPLHILTNWDAQNAAQCSRR